MTRYYAQHLKKLTNEAHTRFDKLMYVLDTGTSRGNDGVPVDGTEIRLAVDDFKVILAEIRKLK